MCARPSYVLPALACIGLNAQVLILVLGREWGSFWCFQASLLGLVALVEPWLFERLGELDFFDRAPAKAGKAGGRLEAEAEAVGATEEVDPLVA